MNKLTKEDNPNIQKPELTSASNNLLKRKLPLIQDINNATRTLAITTSEESTEKETSLNTLIKIARAFLRNTYPLSEQGQKLKETITALLEQEKFSELIDLQNQLPTVEEPHEELFAELSLDRDDLNKIMGNQLANIQITKGCSHKCTFCAASAAGKVEFMPYVAILKLATEKKALDAQIESSWQKLCRDKQIESDDFIQISVKEFKEYFKNSEKILSKGLKLFYSLDSIEAFIKHPNGLEVNSDYQKLCAILFRKDDSAETALIRFIEEKPQLIELLNNLLNDPDPLKDGSFTEDEKKRKEKALRPRMEDLKRFLGNLKSLRGTFDEAKLMLDFRDFKKNITNYYDSDVFDFRDHSFLHQDGSPAHFGDVLTTLGSKIRPIHITTAGWSEKDKSAQQAGEIVAANRDLISSIRISVNSSEIDAVKDYQKYFNKIKNTILTLKKIKPVVMMFADKSKPEFTEEVLEPLTKLCTQEGIRFMSPNISKYSGPERDEAKAEHDHDVMSCMPGYHIWPDGTVHFQKSDDMSYDSFGAPKGSRPEPTGLSVYTKTIPT